LLLSPLKAWQFLFSKFFGMWISCLFIIATTFLVIFPGLIYFPFSISHLLSGYLGIMLCVGCYLAVGVFCAICIDSPLLAALSGFALLLGMMLLIAMAQAVDHFYLSQLLRHLSVPLHFEYFLRGLIKSSDLVYLFSFIFIFLYASREVLHIRENW
jgi:ABC-type transport system involved in multi-copper enzyme maturation permease subunit